MSKWKIIASIFSWLILSSEAKASDKIESDDLVSLKKAFSLSRESWQLADVETHFSLIRPEAKRIGTGGVLDDRLQDVDYEEVVSDLEGQVRRILDYCELGWEESCIRFYETDRSVKSASSEQVRKPIYKTSVNTWRHFESHLGDLIETLEPVLAKLPKRERPIRFN